MHWVAIHYIGGYSLEDWVAILTIIGMIIAAIGWIGKCYRNAINNLRNDVLDPIYKEMSRLNHNMEISNRQHEEDHERLERGDKKFIRHDEQLKDHERRITNLERMDHK